jgi:hypothetical protein
MCYVALERGRAVCYIDGAGSKVNRELESQQQPNVVGLNTTGIKKFLYLVM